MSGFEHITKAMARYGGRLQRAINDLPAALLRLPQHGALLSQKKPNQLARFRHLAVLWVIGCIALAFVTLVCFLLGLNPGAAALVYLVVIMLLSLLDSFISSAIFSVIAVLCLNFFIVEPIFSFEVAETRDLLTIITLLLTSLVVTGLVRRMRALADAHREQAQLLDLTSDSVFVRDMHDVITYWNRGAEELYGWKRDEAIGKITHQLLQTVFPAPLEEIEESLSRTGRWEGQLVHTTRDGRRVFAASRWSLQQDERGLPIGTLETNTDITERKRAEDALRQSQAAYLAEAQKLSHTGSFGWNVSSGELFWSEESFRIFGYGPATKPTVEMALDRVHPDDVARVRQEIDRAASDKKDFDFGHRLLMPDGSVKHVQIVAHASTDEAGRTEFVGAVMDVTAAKEASNKIQLIIDTVPALIWTAKPDGSLDFISQRLLDYQGLTLEQKMGQGWGAQLHPDDIDHVQSKWRAAVAEGKPFEAETRLRRFDGEYRWFLYRAFPLFDRAGRNLGWYGNDTDIHDGKQAEEALRQAQADLARVNRVTTMGELAASLAHEVNQPIGAAVANAESCLSWLAGEVPNLEEARAAASNIVKNGMRAAEIITRTRLLFKKDTWQREPVDVDEVIREMIVLLRNEATRYSISVRTELAADLPRVMGDRVQLQQVAMNLIMNGIEAMKDVDGTRELAIKSQRAENGQIMVSVSDTGVGLPPRQADQIFNAFFTTKPHGTGMGLSISRSIVEAHGGRLRAVDNSPRGASFHVTLPAKVEAHG